VEEPMKPEFLDLASGMVAHKMKHIIWHGVRVVVMGLGQNPRPPATSDSASSHRTPDLQKRTGAFVVSREFTMGTRHSYSDRIVVW
tara:strand:+ start:1368 stop:1625 length:258 start_codon:yes stop_codon:yes gene_type:complete